MRQHHEDGGQPKRGHPCSDEIEATEREAGETTNSENFTELAAGVAHGNQRAEAGADTSNTD